MNEYLVSSNKLEIIYLEFTSGRDSYSNKEIAKYGIEVQRTGLVWTFDLLLSVPGSLNFQVRSRIMYTVW